MTSQLTVQALELEDLPEDDEEDIDFTLEGLLGPLESDLEDDVAEMAAAVAEAPCTRAAAKRPTRYAGSQDPSRCVLVLAWSLHTTPQWLHALLHFLAWLVDRGIGVCNPHSVRLCGLSLYIAHFGRMLLRWYGLTYSLVLFLQSCEDRVLHVCNGSRLAQTDKPADTLAEDA